MKVSRWIDNCIVKQSAWLYQKVDNALGSEYARAGLAELDAVETTEE